MRVMGIDPGSRKTGYGVVERNGNLFSVVAHGTITAPARADLPQRIHVMFQRAGALIDEFSPDCVAVEEAFYHESVRSTLVLGHVRGALLIAIAERRAEIAEYSPREIKMSVTGSGAAAKEQVAYMVRRLLAIRGAMQADAADALAAALCHLHRVRISEPARAASAAAQRLEALLQRRSVR